MEKKGEIQIFSVLISPLKDHKLDMKNNWTNGNIESLPKKYKLSERNKIQKVKNQKF